VIAAIHARKSTGQHVADAPKNVTRQAAPDFNDVAAISASIRF